METPPIDLLFGGLPQLGPGGDEHTRHVLGLLPPRPLRCIVDAGCGTGRQTLVLAAATGAPVHAVDTHAPFLAELERRARDAGVAGQVHRHHMDMAEIPRVFSGVDLIWSEGAAYNIGFAHALRTWAPALVPGGLVVVSELAWLHPEPPEPARTFFRTGYPAMQSVEDNVAAAEAAGYRVLTTYVLPHEAWVQGYYEHLAPRARALETHPHPLVREMARETLEEIAVFEASGDSYGYVFFVLQRR